MEKVFYFSVVQMENNEETPGEFPDKAACCLHHSGLEIQRTDVYTMMFFHKLVIFFSFFYQVSPKLIPMQQIAA